MCFSLCRTTQDAIFGATLSERSVSKGEVKFFGRLFFDSHLVAKHCLNYVKELQSEAVFYSRGRLPHSAALAAAFHSQ